MLQFQQWTIGFKVLILIDQSHILKGIAVDVYRAKKLAKAGQELISEYNFTKEILEPKCLELRSLCKKQELMFTQKRQTLLKFLHLFQSLDSIKRVGW